MLIVTVSDIHALIDELGGLKGASEFFAATPQRVWNWRQRGQLPSNLYLHQSAALEARGIRAEPSLWGQSSTPTPSGTPAVSL